MFVTVITLLRQLISILLVTDARIDNLRSDLEADENRLLVELVLAIGAVGLGSIILLGAFVRELKIRQMELLEKEKKKKKELD